jgi:hypothetical protein
MIIVLFLYHPFLDPLKSLGSIRDIIIVPCSEINKDSELCAFCKDSRIVIDLLQHRTQMHQRSMKHLGMKCVYFRISSKLARAVILPTCIQKVSSSNFD